MSETLKPCLCGSIDVAERHLDPTDSSFCYQLECQRCFLKTAHFRTKKDAIVAWNHRVVAHVVTFKCPYWKGICLRYACRHYVCEELGGSRRGHLGYAGHYCQKDKKHVIKLGEIQQ